MRLAWTSTSTADRQTLCSGMTNGAARPPRMRLVLLSGRSAPSVLFLQLGRAGIKAVCTVAEAVCTVAEVACTLAEEVCTVGEAVCTVGEAVCTVGEELPQSLLTSPQTLTRVLQE